MPSRRSSPTLTFTPHGESTFEHIVRRFDLLPSQYLRKTQRMGAQRQRHKYVTNTKTKTTKTTSRLNQTTHSSHDPNSPPSRQGADQIGE